MILEGTIDHIIFRNSENGYTVLEILDGSGELFTVVGSMPQFDSGETVAFTGEFIKHPVYDLQFKMTSCEPKVPEDRESILRYLSSGAVKGIGKGLAARIVDRFDADSFRIIEEEPERLAEVKGISIRKAMEIASAFGEKASTRQAFSFLQQFNISNSFIQKIYDRYKDGLYETIRKNPYRLIEDIEGIGFKTADRIAEGVGLKSDSEYRVRYGILYVLTEGEAEGNTCLRQEDLIKRSEELLSVSEEEIEIQLQNLSLERKVILHNAKETGIMVYSASAYRAESECARILLDLNSKNESDEDILEKEVASLEKTIGIKLEDMQRQAVIRAISDGVFIMTGGPGTGKTTTINAMIQYFINQGYDITLTAPTGRAAKRMTEATGYEAATIHRLLGAGGASEGSPSKFEHNEENPLETDVLIVDEMSMVDIYLFRNLLKALVSGTKLILVGDENQLPSVGPGAVLKDMIASKKFNVITLTRIYRQSEAGDIVMNAHNIRLGKEIRLDNRSKDFFFLERQNPEEIIRGMVYLINSKLPPYVHCKSGEIQVMSPMRKGALGVENLNKRLQEALNPPE
ncbi:MAG: AAA family ATPase, partial [Lachnospiraceae bacterium]|nr:AAA family ATPase [Lachnospiraceae bacterium]